MQTLISFFSFQPTVSGEIDSPMGAAAVEFIDPREPVAVWILLYSLLDLIAW